MRLHRLDVTAFGPFAGTETVDFDALAGAGLFLFTGATGAGKTSILDAVCFALYGQVPGARGTARGLRSDHAVDGVAPAVVLEVSLRGRRLRMTRSPAWERPKRRGSGTMTEQARVHLEERTGAGWQTLSTRLDETGHLVDGLLGLTLAQFCQVVLLPQGQFADFLRADAERRRTLLESLFDTGRFTTVERWLVARRQETTRALDEVDQRLAQVLARLAEAAGAELPADLDPADAAGWVAALLEQARTVRADSQTRAAAAEDRHEASAATLESAALVAEAHTRRTRLRARLAVLTAAAGEHVAAAAVVEAAWAVAPVVPLVAEVARLQVELETARAAAAAAGTELAAVLPATGTDGAALGSAVGSTRMPAPTELSSVARRRRDEVAQLRALGNAEAEADRLAAATDALQRRVVELDAQAERLAARLDGAQARRAELEAARDRSQAAVAALPGAVAARDLAAGRSEAAALRDRLDAQRTALADAVRTRTDGAQAARQTWLDLRQARLDGMAAELAAGLVDGAGCPVCGSTEHPGPAEAGPGSIGLDDETAAADILASAEDLRAAAADQLAALDTRRAAARAAAGGDETQEALRSARDTAVDTATALTELAAAAESDAAALARFGEEHEEWMRQRVSLDQDAATLKAQVLADRDRLRALRATLDDARGTDPSIAARVARLARLADGLDALVRQVETVDRLEEQVTAALDRAEQAAHDRGLDSLEAVMTAARDDEVLHHLDEARRRHEADLASVRAQLAEPALSVLADAPAPDLHGLREQVRVTQAARAAAAAVLSAASARVDALLRLGAGLRDVLAERAPMAEDHRTVDGLSRLAEGKGGDNRLRMSLSGYVLAGRLEQVAASASERLSRMSSGRYLLVHTADAGPGRARGGLHLRVLDAWTGVERDPASLSGGETFLASLSLALGLADVVTGEAGGTLLETLFVDEGFGSLDDDTLDEVMGVLDGLRDGGRTVGIVSHVADLRQRVPVQLRVEKGRAGSHVRQ
jgi:DNA repair protein SbcC/Rad50